MVFGVFREIREKRGLEMGTESVKKEENERGWRLVAQESVYEKEAVESSDSWV